MTDKPFKSPWAPQWPKKKEQIQQSIAGARVRILRGPHKGHLGEITKSIRGGVNLRVKHTDDSTALYHKDDVKYFKEEAPVNSIGTGEIAGAGVGEAGEPGVRKTKYKARNEKDTAIIKDMLRRKMK